MHVCIVYNVYFSIIFIIIVNRKIINNIPIVTTKGNVVIKIKLVHCYFDKFFYFVNITSWHFFLKIIKISNTNLKRLKIYHNIAFKTI